MTRYWYWRWRLLGKEPEGYLGCGGPLAQQAVAWSDAAAGSVELMLEGLPFRVCQGGCRDRRLARPGFAEELEQVLLDGGHLPVAQGAPGSGALSCYACANRVWRPGPATGEVRGVLPFPGLPNVTAVVQGPVRTCNGCGRLQLEPSERLRQDLRAAVRGNLEAAGVRLTFR